jgi:hypothetical protein
VTTRFRRQIVCQSGEPRTRPVDRWTKWLVAFWFQVPEHRRRRRNLSASPTPVGDAQPFELQALADGALLEKVGAFRFPLDMPMAKRREIVDAELRAKHQELFGFLPDAVTLAPVVVADALAGDRSARA